MCHTFIFVNKTKKLFFFSFLNLFLAFFSTLPSTQTIKVIDLIFFNDLALANWAMQMHFNPIPKDVMQGKLFQKCTHLLYCSVLSHGGNVNTRRMLQPDMGSIFNIKRSMKFSGHRKLLCELWIIKIIKFNAFNLLGYWTNTDASILVYKFQPQRTGLNMYAEYTRQQLTFLALHPCRNTTV